MHEVRRRRPLIEAVKHCRPKVLRNVEQPFIAFLRARQQVSRCRPSGECWCMWGELGWKKVFSTHALSCLLTQTVHPSNIILFLGLDSPLLSLFRVGHDCCSSLLSRAGLDRWNRLLPGSSFSPSCCCPTASAPRCFFFFSCGVRSSVSAFLLGFSPDFCSTSPSCFLFGPAGSLPGFPLNLSPNRAGPLPGLMRYVS